MQSMPYYQQQQGYQPQASYQPQSNVLNGAPPMMGHPNGLPPMQHPGIPDGSQLGAPTQQPPKRKQVKNACTNCQKACKKCDDARPCPRCIKYGIADTCVNSVRKERKKGIKRGPYKRRQKTGEEKPRKTAAPAAPAAAEINTTEPNQYAMRGPAMPFGYPAGFGQHYDPYGQYAAYHKDQMMPQPYVVNPVYPPMGYPVIVPGGDQQQNNNTSSNNTQPQQQQHYQQHYSQMMQNQQTPPPPRPYEPQHHQAGSPQVYYQQQTHSQPPSQRNSPHLPDVKLDTSNESNFVKPNMTPVPSTSTSTATSSSPDSSSWVPPRS